MNFDDKERWTKSCPGCGSPQIYSSWDSLRFAIRKNTICNSCRANEKKTRPTSDKWKRVCSSCQKEIVYKSVKSYLLCVRNNTKCRKCATKESGKTNRGWMVTEDYRNKMSNVLKMVRNTDIYGEEFKRKCRENKLRKIQQQGVQRTYNPEACRFIDRFNVKFGIQLRHGLNGGEIKFIGYSLDGYDKERNIVFEYDEPKHHILSVKKKDEERQQRLIEYLHPIAFFRYDEKYKKLMEVIGNKEVICQLL